MNSPGNEKRAGNDGDFASQASAKQAGFMKEFWLFLRGNKKWWLTPIVMFLLLFGVILVLAKGSALAPFIYSLF